MDTPAYGLAEPDDETAIKALLKKCDLPFDDIPSHLKNFVVAKVDDIIIGVNGIEIYGQAGLIRSLAIDPAFRGRGIARELNTRIQRRAQLAGVKELYLLTQTAEQYSAVLGFRKVSRDSAPEPIQATGEFKSLCPKTAVCMMKRIGGV